MKCLFKYIGICSLFIFSLIYTNNIVDFLKSNTSLMKEIHQKSPSKRIKAVDAQIFGDYIVPGLNGLTVNESKSYSNMISTNTFDENLIIYDEIIPTISLSDNIEKIINKANSLKNAISIIIDNSSYCSFFYNRNIKVNYLVSFDNMISSKNVEILNNETKDFYKMESFLNRRNINTNICLVTDKNEMLCRKNKKYLVKPTYTINNSNLYSYISEIDKGDIIKVENLSTPNLIILINKINYRDLRIIYLSELISEKHYGI